MHVSAVSSTAPRLAAEPEAVKNDVRLGVGDPQTRRRRMELLLLTTDPTPASVLPAVDLLPVKIRSAPPEAA